MSKLYFRLFGLMVLFMAASIAIQELAVIKVTEIAVRDDVAAWERAQARERLRPIFRFTEAALAPYPEAEWAERFKAYGSYFAYPARILSFDEAAGDSAEGRGRIEQGGIWMVPRAEGGWLASARLGQSRQALLVTLPEPQSRREHWRRVGSAINAAIELATLALLALVLLRPLWRDLGKLDRAAARIGDGDFDVETGVRARSPLARLARSFDAMKAKTKAMIKAQREMTYAVSHELRNPLMRLKFRYQLAREEVSLGPVQRHLALMQRDIDELDRLSDEVLTYAKLDPQNRLEHSEFVDVAAVAASSVDAAREEVELSGANVRVSLEGAASASVAGHPDYLLRAIRNLVLNAVKFANSAVRLRLEADPKVVRVSVDDDGPGVPEAERARILEPFARLDRSRDRKTGGYGMGLAIVQRIATGHGGEVLVGESDLGGARFTLVLPRGAAHEC